MKKTACIIHGWGADSTSNWFPWLARELEKSDWDVRAPDFPHTQNPKLQEWLKHFNSVVAELALEQNIKPHELQLHLIGHSLGVPFILRYLESLPEVQIDASYLVAGFDKGLGIPEIENFVDKPFDWKRIRAHCKKFIVINSDNDPYIPLEVGESLAKSLHTKLTVEHNGEHLNAPEGYLAFPKLLGLLLAK